MIIFSTPKYEYLKKSILTLPRFISGEMECNTFPDGEHYKFIKSDVKNKDVVLIGGTISNDDTLDMLDTAHTLLNMGVRTLSIVIPYFGYSTMERASKKGEAVPAKVRALLFSSLPQAPSGNRIFLIDLHSEGIPHYFEGNSKVVHLYAKKEIMKLATEISEGKDFILASTDAGRAKWVESLANDMNVQAAFVYKQRLSGTETKVTGVNADVTGKHVIIYDDMIRTGGSLIHAAEAYKKAGASKISAITTHAIFPDVKGESTIEKLENTKLFYKIGATNTHPRILEPDFKNVLVKDLSELIALALLDHA